MKTHVLMWCWLCGLALPLGVGVPRATAAPLNDNFANAIAVSSLRGETTGDLAGATVEPGEKGTGLGSNSVWWLWKVPLAGWYAFDTYGSDCDAVLGVWQGSNVATLTMIGTNDNELGTWSLVPFEAVSSAVYYAQVSGKTLSDTGAVKLRWYPLATINQVHSTSEVHTVWFDRSGLALSQPLYTVTIQRVWLTPDNYVLTRRATSVPSISSATLTHWSGRALFTLQPFQRAPRSPRIVTFRDGFVLLRGTASPSGTQLTINGASTTNFAAGASLVIRSNFHSAVALDRGLYVVLTNGADAMGAAFFAGYKLTRRGWEVPVTPGAFAGLFDTGFTMHTNVAAGTLTCTIARKGKETASIALPLPTSGSIQLLGSCKGSVLTWVKRGATNGPMSLTSAKGVSLFSDFAPQEGPLFSQCLFDGGRILFVYGTVGTNATISVYTTKAPPQRVGAVTVPHFRQVLFDRADLLTVGTVTGVTTVTCYQKKLKPKWSCEAPGTFFGAYGGGVFATRETTPSNDVYRLYARDTAIGTYTFTRK